MSTFVHDHLQLKQFDPNLEKPFHFSLFFRRSSLNELTQSSVLFGTPPSQSNSRAKHFSLAQHPSVPRRTLLSTHCSSWLLLEPSPPLPLPHPLLISSRSKPLLKTPSSPPPFYRTRRLCLFAGSLSKLVKPMTENILSPELER